MASRWMPGWLVLLSFLENTVLLIAIEPLIIPVMAVRRAEAFFLAFLLGLGSLLGALATYWVALSLFESVVEPVLRFGEVSSEFANVRQEVNERGFWGLFLIGVTPVPFQLGTVAAGVLRMPMIDFVAAVFLSRSLRYIGLAALVFVIGARAENFIKRYQSEIALGFLGLFVALVLGGWAVSYVF